MPDFLYSNCHDLGLGLLCGLRPKFHHAEHKPTNTNRTLGVLTDAASSSGIWVQEICGCSHAALVADKVFATGLVGRRVEYSKFFRLAVNRLVPGSENKQRTHEVVERVEVVYPGRHCS